MLPAGTRPWWSVRPDQVPAKDQRLGVLARGKVPSLLRGNHRRSFFRVVLWKDLDAFHFWWGDKEPHGAFCPSPTRIRFPGGQRTVVTPTCLGSLHLVRGSVTLEVLAHECMHAMVRRMQAEQPSVKEIVDQAEGPRHWSGRADEEVAYEMGFWVSALAQWIEDFERTA